MTCRSGFIQSLKPISSSASRRYFRPITLPVPLPRVYVHFRILCLLERAFADPFSLLAFEYTPVCFCDAMSTHGIVLVCELLSGHGSDQDFTGQG